MQVLILDGHPDAGRLVTDLLNHYATSLEEVSVERLALRDLVFDPNLHRGYAEDQAWEPDSNEWRQRSTLATIWSWASHSGGPLVRDVARQLSPSSIGT